MNIYIKIFILGWFVVLGIEASILKVAENKYLKVNSDATIMYVDTEEKATNCFTVYRVYHLGLTSPLLRVVFVPSTIITDSDQTSLFYLGYNTREKFFLAKYSSLVGKEMPKDILWRVSFIEDAYCLIHNMYRKMVLMVENQVF